MTKQVLVVRRDLKMRRGKEVAQGSHASESFITRQLQSNKGSFFTRLLRRCLRAFGADLVFLSPVEREWIEESFTKVCVRVESQAELLDIAKRADEAGVQCHVVIDSGKTEFDGEPTMTCLALGPDTPERIDPITGRLELY